MLCLIQQKTLKEKVVINLEELEKKDIAVKMRDITKRFGSIVANDKCWLNIYRGEVLALLGENGSGKTTLMNMLSGIYFPDEGQIFVDGKEVSIRSPKDAMELGIGMIHQHFKLVDVLTATENIILGLDEPGKLDLKAAADKIREICDLYGFEVNPDQKIYDMSVSQKQTVAGSRPTLRRSPKHARRRQGCCNHHA